MAAEEGEPKFSLVWVRVARTRQAADARDREPWLSAGNSTDLKQLANRPLNVCNLPFFESIAVNSTW